MQVRVSIRRKVIVDCQIDALDVNATAKDVCGNTNTLVELLELLVPFDASKFISNCNHKDRLFS